MFGRLMANINEIFKRDKTDWSGNRRTISPHDRPAAIARAVYFFNKIRDEYRRNHPNTQAGQDEKTIRSDIRAGVHEDKTGVRRQGLGLFNASESAESDRRRYYEGIAERVFLQRMSDGKQQDSGKGDD